MSKPKKRADRARDWNPSHKTRFSSEHQPARRRGPAKIRLDRNLLRMFADALNEDAKVTNSRGDRLKMTQADYMVQALIKKAMKGGLDDLLKLFDRFDRWGLLEQLNIEEGLLEELQEQLREEKESNERLQLSHSLSAQLSSHRLSEAMGLLASAEALILKSDIGRTNDAVALQRRILCLRLELEDDRRAKENPRPLRWQSGETEEQWIRAISSECDEQQRLRAERVRDFDRQHPSADGESRSHDSDDDDDFFGDLTSED